MMKAYMKGYEDKFRLFANLLKNSKDREIHILEIGSHFGEDTNRFLHVFGEKIAKIYCFEPDPRSAEIFQKHVEDDRVILFQKALSNKTGSLPFYQSYNASETSVPEKYGWIEEKDYDELKLGNSGSSSLKKGYSSTLSAPISVDAVRYDEWAEENDVSRIDLAWIDVQGAERDVIEGMGNRISGIKYVWIEYGETAYEDAMTFSETVDLMSSKNFLFLGTTSPNPHSIPGDALFKLGAAS